MLRYPIAYADFLGEFFPKLFRDKDHTYLLRLPPPPPPLTGEEISSGSLEQVFEDMEDPPPRFTGSETEFVWDQALNWLIGNENTPNIYFCQASFPPNTRRAKDYALRIRSFCVDMDYGTVGHKKPGPYQDRQETLEYLLDMPILPTYAWGTGHGVQAIFILDEWFDLPAESDGMNGLDRWERVSKAISSMTLSDSTFTAEHYFRVPQSLNHKPPAPLVRGELLIYQPERLYTFKELEALASSYGIKDPDPEAFVELPELTDEDQAEYDDLPEEIREMIEAGTHADRSVEMHRIIGKLLFRGYDEEAIHEFVSRSPASHASFPGRLPEEIDRSINKYRNQPFVHYDRQSYLPILFSLPEPTDVDLEDCPPLQPKMDCHLKKLAHTRGMDVPEKMPETFRLLDHMVGTKRRGVVELPCGTGKTTWALCHIAANAGAANQYVYVAETLDAVYQAAETIEQLNGQLRVGRYHGFDAGRCHALCGKRHKYQECSLSDKKAVCHSCGQRRRCNYYTRTDQLKRSAVVMAHQGYLRLAESESSEQLKGRTILIDEDVNAFLYEEFTATELSLAATYLEHLTNLDRPWIPSLLPHGFLDRRLGCVATGKCFASEHFVFRSPRQVHEASTDVDKIRGVWKRAIEDGDYDLETFPASSVESAREVLARISNFFRASLESRASYAYRKVPTRQGVEFHVKKKRLDFGIVAKTQRLWVLNASARLSYQDYPDDMPIYRCPELAPDGRNVMLHVIKGNPTQKKTKKHLDCALTLIENGRLRGSHTDVLLTLGKRGEAALTQAVEQALPGSEVTTLRRGRIRGSNEARECTLGILAGMSFFTKVDDYALTTCLDMQRTFRVTEVYNRAGGLLMPRGRFAIPRMQEYYARRALDELYQTLFRTAARDGKPVEAIVVLPDVEWLSALWRTVLPGLDVAGAWKINPLGHLVPDPLPMGLCELARVAPGTAIPKREVAKKLGYVGKTGWRDHRRQIMAILAPYYEEDPSDNQRLIRLDDTK